MSEPAPATTEPNGNNPAAASASPIEYVATLIAAIQADDGKSIAETIDSLLELQGSAGVVIVRAAVQAAGLADKMLDALTVYSKRENTSGAWAHLSLGARLLGRQDVALEAARTGLRVNPADVMAALMLAANANDRGDFDEALKVLAELNEHVTGAKDYPPFVLQFATAQIGIGNPEEALSKIDQALTTLAGTEFEFDARFIRARALRALPERLSGSVNAWEAAVKAAKIPEQMDLARDGLVETLMRLEKYDAALRELDVAIKNAANENQRALWSKVRPSLLARTGDVKGALSALEDLIKTTTAPDDRVQSRLMQARIAVLGKLWPEAAGYFDQARAEIPPTPDQPSDRSDKIRIEKVQSIGGNQFDLVTADLDALDASWTANTWPPSIDFRIGAMLTSGKGEVALKWLDYKLAATPGFANHPAVHQLRGEILLRLKGLDDALPEYARAIAVPSDFRDDPRAWVAALMGAFITQQWKLVLEAYEQLNRTAPGNQDETMRMFAAQAHLRLGELESALKLTEDDLKTPNPTVHAIRDSARGEAQLRLGHVDESLATTDAALKRVKGTDPADVQAEFLLSLNLLRAQALNAKEKFAEAYDAATEAIQVPEQAGASLKGLTSFVRLAAYMQRSLASYRLGNLANAQSDVDKAITGYEEIRNSSIVRALKVAPEFEQFEFSLWFAKAATLDAEDRTEEALAAYERAEKFETKGNAATVGRGYALSGTGAFAESLEVFDKALSRASSARERSEAFAGKGRALVRLGRFEEGVVALQAALGERLTEPDKDPQVFELLGIAYDALKRNGAAKRAFRRAWDLTKPEKRTANLVRGITAAELRLNNPNGALKFLDEVCGDSDELRRNNPDGADPRYEIAQDSRLIFNRALALDGIGKRREAIRCLVRASEAGLDQAKSVLGRFTAPDRLTRWTNDWFGSQARLQRRILGFVLVVIAVTGLGAPLFQWWADGKIGWYLLMVPSIVALLLLLLPNIKSIGYGDAKVEFSADPLPATSREAAVVTAPESFTTPVLTAALLSKPVIEERKDDAPAFDAVLKLNAIFPTKDNV